MVKNESRELFSKGFTLSKISDTLKINVSRVKYYIYGVGMIPEIIQKEKVTEYQQKRIRQLLLIGDYTFHEIADEVGLKAKDISEFVKRG